MSHRTVFKARIRGTVARASSSALGTATRMRYGFSSIFSRSAAVFFYPAGQIGQRISSGGASRTHPARIPGSTFPAPVHFNRVPAREPSDLEKSTTFPISAIQWPGASVRTAMATMSAPALFLSRAGSGVVPVTLPKRGHTPLPYKLVAQHAQGPPSLSIFMGALMPPSWRTSEFHVPCAAGTRIPPSADCQTGGTWTRNAPPPGKMRVFSPAPPSCRSGLWRKPARALPAQARQTVRALRPSRNASTAHPSGWPSSRNTGNWQWSF